MHRTWENKLKIFHICLLASELFTAHLLGTSLQTLRLKITLKKQSVTVVIWLLASRTWDVMENTKANQDKLKTAVDAGCPRSQLQLYAGALALSTAFWQGGQPMAMAQWYHFSCVKSEVFVLFPNEEIDSKIHLHFLFIHTICYYCFSTAFRTVNLMSHLQSALIRRCPVFSMCSPPICQRGWCEYIGMLSRAWYVIAVYHSCVIFIMHIVLSI